MVRVSADPPHWLAGYPTFAVFTGFEAASNGWSDGSRHCTAVSTASCWLAGSSTAMGAGEGGAGEAAGPWAKHRQSL